MTTITLWLLIATTTSGPLARLADFADERTCRMASAELERKSTESRGMRTVFSVCIEAKVVNP